MLGGKYQAVIFDLDGTLIDSMWIWEKVDEFFLGEFGYKIPEGMDKALEGKSFTETAVYFKTYFKLEMSIEEIKSKWTEMAWDFYTTKVPLKEGAKSFLQWLKQQGVKMGIASSNSRELVLAVLKALGIEGYFEVIKTACEVGKGKPFPDIYLEAAKELKVSPQQCLVFEDIPNGIRAGLAAGMEAWGMEDGQKVEVKEEMKSLTPYFGQDYFEVMAYYNKVAGSDFG